MTGNGFHLAEFLQVLLLWVVVWGGFGWLEYRRQNKSTKKEQV